jgi:exosome complex RNA-binding protein Rrp42 (RNase PH superfamily)
MVGIIQSLYGSIINREELMLSEGQFCWFLNVDILVMEELSMHQIDYIGLAVRTAFQNMQIPQVYVTTNENTGKIDVGLAEEIYEDQENTDTLKGLSSAKNAPYIVSIGFVRNSTGGEDAIVVDCDEMELQCVDQIMHIAVDSRLKIHGIEQSRGQSQPGFMNIKYLKAANL